MYGADQVQKANAQDWAAVVAQSLRFPRPTQTVKTQLKLLGSVSPELAAIRVPCLCISGQKDLVVPPENSASLAKQLTGSVKTAVAIVPDAGHLPWGVCPPRLGLTTDSKVTPEPTRFVAAVIRSFLD